MSGGRVNWHGLDNREGCAVGSPIDVFKTFPNDMYWEGITLQQFKRLTRFCPLVQTQCIKENLARKFPLIVALLMEYGCQRHKKDEERCGVRWSEEGRRWESPCRPASCEGRGRV